MWVLWCLAAALNSAVHRNSALAECLSFILIFASLSQQENTGGKCVHWAHCTKPRHRAKHKTIAKDNSPGRLQETREPWACPHSFLACHSLAAYVTQLMQTPNAVVRTGAGGSVVTARFTPSQLYDMDSGYCPILKPSTLFLLLPQSEKNKTLIPGCGTSSWPCRSPVGIVATPKTRTCWCAVKKDLKCFQNHNPAFFSHLFCTRCSARSNPKRKNCLATSQGAWRTDLSCSELWSLLTRTMRFTSR